MTESVQSPAVLEKCGLFAHKISRVDIVTESTEKQKSKLLPIHVWHQWSLLVPIHM